MYRTLFSACAVLATALSFSTGAAAQAGGAVSGRLVNSLSGDPIPGAVVVIEELRRETTSDASGNFTFPNVPEGTYHVSVRARAIRRAAAR